MSDDFNFGNEATVAGDGLRKYMISVFNKMFLALCVTGCSALICTSSPDIIKFMMGGSSIIMFLGMFGLVIYLTKRIGDMPLERATLLFWVFSAVMGASLSPIFIMYTGTSIASSFFMTAAFFGGMSLLGYTTKKDLTSMGSFMFVGLICLIVTSLVNAFFLKSTPLQLGLSALTIVIFAGLTAYDVQKIKYIYSSVDQSEIAGKKAILGALTLYMDFINMFLAVLRIFGAINDRR